MTGRRHAIHADASTGRRERQPWISRGGPLAKGSSRAANNARGCSRAGAGRRDVAGRTGFSRRRTADDCWATGASQQEVRQLQGCIGAGVSGVEAGAPCAPCAAWPSCADCPSGAACSWYASTCITHGRSVVGTTLSSANHTPRSEASKGCRRQRPTIRIKLRHSAAGTSSDRAGRPVRPAN